VSQSQHMTRVTHLTSWPPATVLLRLLSTSLILVCLITAFYTGRRHLRKTPIYVSSTTRPFYRLDQAVFRSALQSSQLGSPSSWIGLDVDQMAQLYDSEITAILDRLVPAQTVLRRRRTSDPWFDDDCRVAKRCVRLFERDVRRIRRRYPDKADAIRVATNIWTKRRREYRELLREKRQLFWQAKVTAFVTTTTVEFCRHTHGSRA